MKANRIVRRITDSGSASQWLRRAGVALAIAAGVIGAERAAVAAGPLATLLGPGRATPSVADFDLLHPGAFRYGCPFVSYDSSEKNSGFLDINALYGIADIPLAQGTDTSIRIEGDFPEVRYFSLQSYEGAQVGNLVDSLPDSLIIPNSGGSIDLNPAVLPYRGGYTDRYTVRIRYAAPPATIAAREPNTLYVGPAASDSSPTRVAKLIGYRIYLANPGADVRGNRALPTIILSTPTGEINLNQTPEQAKCDRNNGLATAFRSFNPVVVPSRDIRFVPVSMSRTGVTFGNGDAYFLRAASSLSYGQIVVVRLRRTVTPPTPPLLVASPQARYMSFCQYNIATTSVISCVPDRNLVTQRDDQQVIVLSRASARPAAATAARGYNWMEYGEGQNQIVALRQLLPDPTFAGSFAPAVENADLPLIQTLGDYAPDVSYCDAATFSAYANAGAVALLQACHAASAR